MADEPKTSSRSSSAGGTRKPRTRAAAGESAAEAAVPAVEAAPDAAEAAAPEAPASEPAQSAPAQSAPAQSAPAQSAPAQSAPVHSAPAHSAPSHSAPAHGAAAHAESSGSGGVALAGLLAGLLGIVLALTYPQWTPIVYGGGSDKQVTAEQVRAEAKAEVAALRATVAAMSEKQVALEQAVRTAKLPGILMVAEDLRTALAGSQPYDGPLNLFRALTGGEGDAGAIITAVEARAKVGVPSEEELRDRFDEAAHAVLMAEQRPEARGNLASQVSDTVASLAAATVRLRWRLDGAPTGDGVTAVVARAEQSVMNGDLTGAVDTLSLLPEPRAALVQPWIEEVKARLAAESVRDQLDAYIITTASRIQ